MSLKAKYKTLNIYRYSEGYFSKPAGYEIDSSFKGLIQPSRGNKVFNNGKETIAADAILFCDIKQTFEAKDIIGYGNARYKIAGASTQPDGIAGITPKRGQHAEYNLIFTQESL